MEIDRFIAKPVEVEVMGEKVMIKPLTTRFYPLITKLSFYSRKILIAQSKLKKGETLKLESVLTKEEIVKKTELESEIAYVTFDQNFEGMTREKFDNMSIGVINEIMEAAAKVNGLTEEKMEEIKKVLVKNDKPDTE